MEGEKGRGKWSNYIIISNNKNKKKLIKIYIFPLLSIKLFCHCGTKLTETEFKNKTLPVPGVVVHAHILSSQEAGTGAELLGECRKITTWVVWENNHLR